jgi:hypothetical protein
MKKSKQAKSMKRLLTMAVLVLITAANSQVYAQDGVGINPTGAVADPSAALDVASTNKGVLVPRMTEAEKVAIASPANGLLIFQTDGVSGFWYYNATTSAWVQAVGPQGTTGPQGAIGPQGPAGATGATGSVGSVTAISGTSNANGATISGGNLTLTPADATNGGVVTTGAQTFAGDKTFTGTTAANSFVKTGGTASQILMADGSVSTGQSVLFNPTNPPTNGMVVYKYFQNNTTTNLYDDGKIRIRLNLGTNKLYLTNVSSNLSEIWSSVGSLKSTGSSSMEMISSSGYFINFGTSTALVGTEVNAYSGLVNPNNYVMSMYISAPDSPSFGLYVINFYFNSPLTSNVYSSMTVNYYKNPMAAP